MPVRNEDGAAAIKGEVPEILKHQRRIGVERISAARQHELRRSSCLRVRERSTQRSRIVRIRLAHSVSRAVEHRPHRIPRRIDLELYGAFRQVLQRDLARLRIARCGDERERLAFLYLEVGDFRLDPVPSVELKAIVLLPASLKLHFAALPFPFRGLDAERGDVLLVAAPSLRAHQHIQVRLVAVPNHPRPERDAVPLAGNEVVGRQRIPPPAELALGDGAVDDDGAVGSDMRKLLAEHSGRSVIRRTWRLRSAGACKHQRRNKKRHD